MSFHFFDDVFLLHFALEAAQGVFQGLTLLQPNFRQTDTPPDPSGRTGYLLQGIGRKSRGSGKKVQSGRLWPESVVSTLLNCDRFHGEAFSRGDIIRQKVKDIG